MIRIPTLAALLVLGLSGMTALGGEYFPLFHRHGGPPPPGKPRCLPHTYERAGMPQCFRTHLEPTNAGDSCGHYIGGGGGHGSGPRCRQDGTWGWDYVGVHFPRHVFLGWNRNRYQGGTGAYGTDYPFEVPDVIGAAASHFRTSGGE